VHQHQKANLYGKRKKKDKKKRKNGKTVRVRSNNRKLGIEAAPLNEQIPRSFTVKD
jgi:hypothetical protein